MIRLLKNTIGYITVALFLSLPAFAQTPTVELKHFDADGLSFDYPAQWTLTDKSTAQTQHLILTRKGSSIEIAILAQRNLILRAQMADARRDITEPLITETARKTGASVKASEPAATEMDVGRVKAEGVRFHGTLGRRKKTGEVYWLRLGLRFVNLAYVRANTDEAQGTAAWKTIHQSLKIETPAFAAGKPGSVAASSVEGRPKVDIGDGDVLNGKSLNLPRPAYPNIARAARASGTVLVQVTIDEQGNVATARAVSGHPLLMAAAVEAARQAKFSPTLFDGEPVKVTGVITYNFLPK
jgi:TonB family protein